MSRALVALTAMVVLLAGCEAPTSTSAASASVEGTMHPSESAVGDHILLTFTITHLSAKVDQLTLLASGDDLRNHNVVDDVRALIGTAKGERVCLTPTNKDLYQCGAVAAGQDAVILMQITPKDAGNFSLEFQPGDGWAPLEGKTDLTFSEIVDP